MNQQKEYTVGEKEGGEHENVNAIKRDTSVSTTFSLKPIDATLDVDPTRQYVKQA